MTPAEALVRVLDALADHPDVDVAARVAVVRAEAFGDVEAAVRRLLVDPTTAAATRDAVRLVFEVDGRPEQPRVQRCDLVTPPGA